MSAQETYARTTDSRLEPTDGEVSLPGFKSTEAGLIPEDWDCVPMAEIARLESGHTPSRRHPSYWNGAVPWVSLHDTESLDGQFIRETAQTITEEGLNNSSARLLPEGTVVFSRTATVGKSTVLGRPMATSQDFANYICGPRLHNHYLVYLFRSMGRVWQGYMAGSIHNTIYMPVFESLKIAVPPIEEQRDIAEALADVDGLNKSLEALISKKRAIKQATMQQLLTGTTRLPGFSGAWEMKPFSSVLERLNAKDCQIQTSEYQTSGRYPVVDQGKEPIVGFSDIEGHLFECPRGGVIVFGDHTCITKFVAFDFVIGADGTQIIRAKNRQVTRFYAYQLQHKGIEPTGYNRHFKLLREREFFVPQPEEQAAIATVLSHMDAEIAALEARRDKTRAIKQGMMQQLLTGRVRLVKPGTAA